MRTFVKRDQLSERAPEDTSREGVSAISYSAATVLGLGVVLTLHHGSHISVALMALGMLGIVCGESFYYFMRLSPLVARRITEKWGAFHITLPVETQLTPEMEWVWCVIFFSSVVIAFWSPLTGSPNVPHGAMNVLLAIIVIAGANEWRHYIQSALRKSWTRGIGKLVLSSLGGILLCVATAEARQFTFLLTHEDAALFPSFVGVMAFVLLPTLYFSTVCLIALVVACAHSPLMLLSLGGSTAQGRAGEEPFAASSPSETGPGTTLPSPPNALRRFTRICRPLSRFMAVFVIVVGTPQFDLSKQAFVQTAARIVLARLEYWPRSVCGAAQAVYAVKIDANHYSVATIHGIDVAMSTVTCPSATPSPTRDARTAL